MIKSTRKFTAALIVFFLLGNLFSQKVNAQLLSDSIDVLNYELHLDVTDYSGQTISGYAILTITPKVDGLLNVALELWSLIIDSVKSNSAVYSFSGYSYDGYSLDITSATTLNKTDTFDLMIAYHGNPVVDPTGWGGFLFQRRI